MSKYIKLDETVNALIELDAKLGSQQQIRKGVRFAIGYVKDLPTIEVSDKADRPEPEEKQRGRLERFNSVELKKILDNFCEQMACPLPEKTKNEIVANVAREHAMTVAADRLSQAMKESENDLCTDDEVSYRKYKPKESDAE